MQDSGAKVASLAAAKAPARAARATGDDPREVVQRALAGDGGAVRALIGELMPVIQARVARMLMRYAGQARGRDIRQELEDLCQEVFVLLFKDSGKVLKAWDPARGMSLANFVGLVAERRVLQVFRSNRQNPWSEDPTEARDLQAKESRRTASAEGAVAAKQLFDRMLDRLTVELSPLGMDMFRALLLEQRKVAEVASAYDMTLKAVYAWQSRLKKRVRKLAAELRREGAV